jgi:putative oxidoreductase
MKKQLLRLARAALILLLFYTAVAKLSNLNRFESELGNQVLPSWSIPLLVWLIPATELVVVLLLLLPRLLLRGLQGAALLMTVFTMYMGLVLLNVFDRVPCSCGGVLKSMGFEVHFIFNLFFLLLSLTGIWLKIRSTPE